MCTAVKYSVDVTLALVKQTTAYRTTTKVFLITTTALFLLVCDESSSNLKAELSNAVYNDVVVLNIYHINRHT